MRWLGLVGVALMFLGYMYFIADCLRGALSRRTRGEWLLQVILLAVGTAMLLFTISYSVE